MTGLALYVIIEYHEGRMLIPTMSEWLTYAVMWGIPFLTAYLLKRR